MRIISQDGLKDLPYEECVLTIEPSVIRGSREVEIFATCNNERYKMGDYEDAVEALKVMTQCREYYKGFVSTNSFLALEKSMDDLNKAVEKIYKFTAFLFPQATEEE